MGGLGSGGARVGSGPKPRTLRERALTNVRARPGDDDRVTAFSPPTRAEPDWQPTPTQRRSLGRRGRAFLSSRLAQYGHSPHEGDVLLRAARALDEAELWRRRAHTWKDPSAAVRAGRLQLLHEREFMSALALLKEQR